MAKPEQQKFYAQPELMERFQQVLDQQGLNNSEGITRLIRLATAAPDNLVPLLFQQAPGEVAVVLAKHILASGSVPGAGRPGGGPKVDVLALDENDEPIAEEELPRPGTGRARRRGKR